MRTALIVLLLANLVMVAVNIFLPRQGDEPLPASLPNIETLKLVSEHEIEPEPQTPAAPVETSEAPVASMPPAEGVAMEELLPESIDESTEASPEPARECFTLGPYRDRDRADDVADRIREAGLPASRRSSVERVLRSYWVLIPPLPNEEAADAIAAQLKRRGVKDFFVTEEPPNAVSLGVFSQRRYADRRVSEMERLGYEVEVEPIYRDRTVYWLDYETRSDNSVPEQVWRGSVPDGSGVERLPRECG
jgi:cell division septation protein DedD